MKNTPSREPRRKGLGTANRDLSAAALALLGFTSLFASCRPAYAQSPAVCVVSGTVLDGGSQPIVGTPVRFRVISPVMSGSAALAVQDLTTNTIAGGAWSLTLVQGLNAQVDIPAAGIAKDTVIPSGVSCPAAFSSLTLYNRGTLTPATILSTAGPSMGGDLTGSSPNPTVVGLRGQQLAAGACTNGQARVYSSGTGTYTCQTVTTGAGVTSVSGGTGITVTGTTTPSVAITAGGVGPTQLAAGAAATNVGTVSGVLAGTLPSPSFAAGAIQNADVNAGAAIAWTKINKAGATAADVGAVATGSAVTSVTAGTGISLSGTGVAPIVNIANGGVTNTQLGTGAAAANLGAAGGDLSGTYPNPSIAAGAIVDADVNAGAAIAWTKVSKAGAAESDIPGLVADLADKLSKGSGGTVVGNTTFSGTTTFNGAAIFSGSFAPAGEFRVVRTADATSPSPQKISNNAVFEGSVWNGSSAEKRLFTLRNTPTALNAGKLSFLGYSTDNVVGSELAYIDATTGAYNGPTAGTHTGPVVGAVTGNVTGNVSGTAATFTGNLTGDVTSSAMATTVQTVSGQTAATVAAGAVLANAATALNTASAIVKRDGSNNFAAGTITANLTGNVTGALTGNATTASDGLTSASGTAPLTLNLAAKSLTGSIADASAGAKGAVQLAGDLNGTATSPGVATVGGQTAANVAAGAVLANAATSSSTINTIVKRDGSGNFAAGTITAALAGNATTATSFTGNLTGDATSSGMATTVVKIQGNAVLAGTPTNGQVYQWVTGNSRFEPTTLTGGGSVTSVQASGGSTGFSFAGGPITGSGTLTMSGTLALANGGTGQTTAGPAFNALAPTTTLGDTIYANGTGTNTRLPGNTTTTRKFLRQTGDSVNSAAPAWDTLVSGDIPANASNTSGTAANVTGTVAIANGGTGQTTAANALIALSGVNKDGTVPLTANWAASTVAHASGLTPSYILSKNSTTFFNVIAYGADPSGTTDSTADINKAITDCLAGGGGTVYFPQGHYKVNSTLVIGAFGTVTRGLTLKGDNGAYAGPGAFNGSTLAWNGTPGTPMIWVKNFQHLVIDGLGMDGSNIATSTAILIDNDNTAGAPTKNNSIRDLCIRRFEHGIAIGTLVGGGASVGQIDSLYVENVVITESVDLAGANTGVAVFINNNNFAYSRFKGLTILGYRYGFQQKSFGSYTIDSCTGGNVGGQTMDFWYTAGNHGTVALDNSECEGIGSGHFIFVDSTATANLNNPITIRNSNVTVSQISQATRLLTEGCQITGAITFASAASVYNSRNDALNGGSIVVGASGTLYSRVSDTIAVGTTAAVAPLEIAAPRSSLNVSGIPVALTDTTALAANTGGALTLRGVYTAGGSITEFATIAAQKDNATTGNFGASLNFYTRCNGVGVWTVAGTGGPCAAGSTMTLTSTGNVGMQNPAPAYSLDVGPTATGGATSNVNGNDQISTTTGATWVRGQATELLTLSTGGTTTDTTANLLPANAVIRSVVVRVTTSITVASAFTLGDATTAGRFLAAGTGLAAGSTGIGLVHIDQTGAAGPRQTAAAKVRVTTTGTPGAGVVRITVFYDQFTAPTS